MHRIRLSPYWLLGFLVLLASSNLTTVGRVAAADDSGWLLAQINTVRAQHGLVPMALNGQLNISATAHSQYLASHVWTDPHVEANGSTPKSRMIAAGYIGEYYSENVYGGGMATAQIAFDWWLGSPIHYAGIVSPTHTEIGIGIASGPYGTFFTTDFGGGGSLSGAQQAAPASNANQAQGPVVTRAPLPTRRPMPTATATASLTPSQTFTPHPTATLTPSGTTIPPTPTAIELAVSPLAVSIVNTHILPSSSVPNIAATQLVTPTLSVPIDSPMITAMVAISLLPSATAVVLSSGPATANQTTGTDVVRILIPVLIGIQALIFGGLLFRRGRSG